MIALFQIEKHKSKVQVPTQSEVPKRQIQIGQAKNFSYFIIFGICLLLKQKNVKYDTLDSGAVTSSMIQILPIAIMKPCSVKLVMVLVEKESI